MVVSLYMNCIFIVVEWLFIFECRFIVSVHVIEWANIFISMVISLCIIILELYLNGCHCEWPFQCL